VKRNASLFFRVNAVSFFYDEIPNFTPCSFQSFPMKEAAWLFLLLAHTAVIMFVTSSASVNAV
jgi:hypothetical protein